jgi:anti-sigma regulatory factor (Ser/Thr protein kinase)
MGTHGVHQRVPATAGAVAQIRNAARLYAAERCGVGDELESSIALAVSEAASNVVLHAYRDGDGEIEFEADVDGDALTVRVRDHGVGIEQPSPNRGLGTGMRIMQGLADVHVDSDGDGTEVELRFQLPAGQPS